MSATALPRTAAITRWAPVAAVVGAGVVSALQVGKAAIATPLLQADLRLDLGAVGWVTAIFAILGVFGGIPAGAMARALGDRRVLVAGLAAVAIGSAAGALSPSFAMLLASRIVEGLGFLLIAVSGPAILQRVVAEAHRTIAFALWSCFMPAGMAIAMLAGPALGDWRVIWWICAALAVAAIAAVFICIGRAAAAAPIPAQRLWADATAVVTGRGPLLLAGCFALYSLMFFALFSFLPVLLMERMQATHGTAGLLSAAATAVNVVGNLGAGWLLARGASRSALIIGATVVMGLCGIGIFLPLLPAVPAFLLCLVFSGIGGMIPATLISSAPIAAPAALTPVVIGLIMQGSNLGQVVGPAAVGGAIAAFGWPAAAVAVLAAALLAAGAARALRPILTPLG
ncbi:MFS transporter [Plastoroseomonas hellenica]|uniref:MFS transporter n=1 Tax=Plastoroseomonas hellenica TaxID=2687306 RepID=UPI001BA8ABAE